MTQGGGHGGRTALAAFGLVALLAVPGFAHAQGGYDTDPTREQWVRQADALCKEANEKSYPLARQFGRAAEKGKAKVAGRKLIKLARHLLGLLEDIGALDPPPADARRIDKWLSVAVRSNRIAIRAGEAFVDKRVGRGNRIYRRSARLTPKLEKLERPFEFRHCS